MKNNKLLKILYLLCILVLLSACGSSGNSNPLSSSQEKNIINAEQEGETEKMLSMKIGNASVQVDWENNNSVSSLKELCKSKTLTITMHMYGGFEQVGSIGSSLPTNDKQMTTTSGDIVLYSGNQIVVFYGSNSWSYTKLGKITNKTDDELSELLGKGNVTLTLSLE
ncbi:MAG: hypothetical protein II567_00535 [Candidatus Riflebacteria bacterium]|nr:hypothetical protein [Candidatus Riflebacteria bacterium]